MSGIIVYTSRYGATEEYAGWLGEETGYPVIRLRDASPSDLDSADIVVIGSNVRIGRIEAGRWIEQQWTQISGKKVVLFSVGLTPPGDEEIAKITGRSIPQSILDEVRYLHLPGRIRPTKLSFLDRQMLKMVAREEKDPEKKAILTGGADRVTRDRICPVVDAIRTLEAELGIGRRDAPSR